jgi:signal transduction histidine kinase
MKLIERYASKNRLYLILLFPIVGILLFAAIGIIDKAHFVNEMKQVERLTRLATKISSLVHETQIERGKTSIYMFSQGSRFHDELLAQYQTTDKLKNIVLILLNSFNDSDFNSKFPVLLQELSSCLEQISSFRNDAIKLTIPMIDAINYYNNLNAKFLNIIAVIPNLTDDTNIAVLGNAYVNLLKGKEKAGIERAIVSGILSLKTATPTLYLKAISLDTEQKTYFENFSFLAAPQYIKQLEKINSAKYNQQLINIRQKVFDKIFADKLNLMPNDTEKTIELNVLQWFKLSSKRINDLKIIEDKLSLDLIEHAQQARIEAFKSLIFYSMLVFMAIVMALVIPLIFKQLQQSKRKLTKNISELNFTRDELVQSEKIASLGRMVAGFAHEINTPIGIAVGAISQIQQSAKDLNTLLQQDEVEEQDLVDKISTIDTVSALAFSNLNRAARLVRSFKRTSIDQVSEKSRRYHIKEVIDDVVYTLNSKLNKTAIKVVVDCPQKLTIFGQPGRFDQLVTNLIINSIAHGFDHGSNAGMININISTTEDKTIQMKYFDNGKGMCQSTIDKIFEPFFTTSRTDGSGLGMYLCYNIVVNDMKGSIHCESNEGEGVMFDIIFPCLEILDLENEN